MISRILLILILLTPIYVFAGQVGTSASYYNDSDDVTIIKYGAWASSSDSISAKYTTVNYSMPGYDKTGSNLTALINAETVNQLTVQGELGVGILDGDSYFVGDISLNKVLNQHVSVFGGISGDVVDSADAIEKDITYVGWNAGIDLSSKYAGLVALIRENHYTDQNELNGWFAKAYVTPFDGIGFYASTKHSKNNSPTTDYYSPEDYKRHSLGISFRRRFENIVIGGFAETGNTYTNGDKGNGNAWRFYINRTITTPWEWSVSIAEDLSDSSNYEYRLIQASIRFDL